MALQGLLVGRDRTLAAVPLRRYGAARRRPRRARAAMTAGGPPLAAGREPAEVGRPRSSLAGNLPPPELTLLDLADRLLDRGVVLSGDATISVAGVDLVYLSLNAVLSSVDALERAGKIGPAAQRGGGGNPGAGDPARPGGEPGGPGGAGRETRPLHDLAAADLARPLEAARVEVERV